MPRFQLLRSLNRLRLLVIGLALAVSISTASLWLVQSDATEWNWRSDWYELKRVAVGNRDEIGWSLILVLSFVLALRILHPRLFPAYYSVTKEDRAITYAFKAYLPVHATIWWRYKSFDTSLTAELEWHGERFATQPKETLIRWARPNRLHAASLLLSDEGALRAAHCVELCVNLRIPFLRKIKWVEELQFDTIERTTNATTPSISPDRVPLGGPQSAPKGELVDEAVNPPRLLRQITHGDSVERALVSIATEFVNSEFPDRTLLRQRLAEKGLSLEFYSPTRVQDSANCMFTRYWFKPDAHAGGWLWAEDDASFLALPFDRSQLTAETMRHYLSSLYQGLGSGFDRRTHLQIESACRLVPGREADEYVLAKPGGFGGDRAPKNDVLLSPLRATNDERKERQSEEESDAVIATLQSRLNSFESRLNRLAQEGKPNDGSRRQNEAIRDELRDLKSRMERELKDFRARLGRVEEGLASLKVARTKDRATVAAREDTPRVHSRSIQHRQLAFGADRLAGSPDVAPPSPPSSAPAPESPQWIPPPGPAKLSSPSIPTGWKLFVAEESAEATVDDYLEPLQRARERLGRLHLGMAKIVHLVESGDHGVYAVHTDDRLETDNGQLVARCAEKPTFRTPSKQFFLALTEPGQESLWILCPPGTYSSLGFDYPTLIDNVPASSFTIASIVTPARLDRRDNALYRIATRMNVTFA